jgi:hypothetical protein
MPLLWYRFHSLRHELLPPQRNHPSERYRGVITLLLLVLISGWIAWIVAQDYGGDREDRARRRQKVEACREAVAQNPTSASAHEQLGDAFREADYPRDAALCYEKAIELESRGGLNIGAGWVGGAGVEQKLRLAQLELSEKEHPEEHGRTLRTRQQVCHSCGALAMPGDRNCTNCGAALAVNTMFDTVRHADMRRSLFQESVSFVIGMTIVAVSLFVASQMPVLLRFSIAFSTAIVLAWRVLKRVGPD